MVPKLHLQSATIDFWTLSVKSGKKWPQAARHRTARRMAPVP